MSDRNVYWKRIAGSLGISFGVTLLALAVLFIVARAQGQADPIVRPDPAFITATAGQTVTVEFVVEGVQDLYGADVRAKFDPAVLEVVDVNPAQDGVQILPGSFLKPDFVVRSVADNAAGTIWYASTQVSPTLPVSGTGVLFSAILRAKAGAALSPITISSVELVDRTGRALVTGPQAAGQTATVTVAEPTATPTLAASPTAAARAAEYRLLRSLWRPKRPLLRRRSRNELWLVAAALCAPRYCHRCLRRGRGWRRGLVGRRRSAS